HRPDPNPDRTAYHPDRTRSDGAAAFHARSDGRYAARSGEEAGPRRPGLMAAETLIADRYQLRDRLGTGGMSTVRLAFDSRLEREVAVKLLAEHLADDENFVSRFRREALAAARLVHPNIVQVFDFGLDDPTGQHYIVMEYVQGRSCAEILREQKILHVDDAHGRTEERRVGET